MVSRANMLGLTKVSQHLAPPLDQYLKEEYIAAWAAPMRSHFPQLRELMALDDQLEESYKEVRHTMPLEHACKIMHNFLHNLEQGDSSENDNDEGILYDNGEEEVTKNLSHL